MALVVFYVLAFALSWLGWVPQLLYAQGRFPFDSPLFALLGGAGPTLAAVLTLLLFREQARIPELFRAVLRFRADGVSVLVSLGYWPLLGAVVLLLGRQLRLFQPDWAAIPWAGLLPLFVTMVLSNVWEEIGWRGFALPRLMKSWSDLSIALIMGALWQLWHLPLMLNPTSPMSTLPWHAELIFTLAQSVIYIWLYRRTRGSLAWVTLFHAMANTLAFILLEMQVFTASYGLVVGGTVLAALILIIRHGSRRLGPVW